MEIFSTANAKQQRSKMYRYQEAVFSPKCFRLDSTTALLNLAALFHVSVSYATYCILGIGCGIKQGDCFDCVDILTGNHWIQGLTLTTDFSSPTSHYTI